MLAIVFYGLCRPWVAIQYLWIVPPSGGRPIPSTQHVYSAYRQIPGHVRLQSQDGFLKGLNQSQWARRLKQMRPATPPRADLRPQT